jgi:hypothetical protein
MKRGLLVDLESVKAVASPERSGTYTSLFIRKISIRVTWLLTRTNLTPNHVTLASFAFSLLSAAFFTGGTWPCYLVSALFLHIKLVLDCVDGELARAKSLRTRGGALLDEVVDRLGDIAVIGAITWAAYRSNPSAYVWLIGFVALGGTFLRLDIGTKVSLLRQSSEVPIDVKALRRDVKFRRFLIVGGDVNILVITVFAIFNRPFLGLILIAFATFADSAMRFAINYKSFLPGDRRADPDG